MSRSLIFPGLLLAASAAALLALLTQPLVRPASPPVAAADPGRLEADVRHLSVDLFPRRQERTDKLDAAAEHILAGLRASGAAVRVQEIPVAGRTYRNVIARFGPAAGPLVVIGAHYDSFDGTPGADDNASGVAGLLELARLLARTPPAGPVELVAYTLEEPPYFLSRDMGSVRHARELKAAGQEVVLMMALEMIGYFSDRPGSQSYPLRAMGWLYPERGDYIALVGKFGGFGSMRRAKALMSGAMEIPVHSINSPTWIPGVDFSDHRSYWAEGFPALMVTDTAFYRNPHYHGPGDLPETLDYRRMAQVVQGVLAIALGFAAGR